MLSGLLMTRVIRATSIVRGIRATRFIRVTGTFIRLEGIGRFIRVIRGYYFQCFFLT